jgi:hypothetical protein
MEHAEKSAGTILNTIGANRGNLEMSYKYRIPQIIFYWDSSTENVMMFHPRLVPVLLVLSVGFQAKADFQSELRALHVSVVFPSDAQYASHLHPCKLTFSSFTAPTIELKRIYPR